MSIHESTLAMWREDVKLLQKGWRWCTACGTVKIEPDMPSYAFKCKSCYGAWRDGAGKGELKVVQEEGYKPMSGAPHTKQIRLSSSGLSKYCTRCGDQIDERRLHFSIFISAGKRECSLCMACSKQYKEPLNPLAPKCKQIFVPNHWLSSAADILPSYQESLFSSPPFPMKRLFASLILPVMFWQVLPPTFDGAIPFPNTSAGSYETGAKASMLMQKQLTRTINGETNTREISVSVPMPTYAPVKYRGTGYLCAREWRVDHMVTICR